MRSDAVAAAILIGSTVVFGAKMVPILKDGLGAPTKVKLPDEPLSDWVSFSVAFGFLLLGVNALRGVAEHYERTGELMSLDEIERQFE